jgi:hypothetical protein
MTNQQHQDDPVQLGKQYGLGNLKAEWKPSVRIYVVLASFYLAFLLLLSVFIVTHSENGHIADTVRSLVVFLLPFTYIIGTALIWAYQWRERRLLIYEGGLIHKAAPRKIPWTIPRPLVRALYEMSKPHTWRHTVVILTEDVVAHWRDIREVQLHRHRDPETNQEDYSYTITLVDGRTLTLDHSFAKRQDLRHTIETGLAVYRTSNP